MLPNTPQWVVGAVMLAGCAYAAAKGFEARARVGEVLFAVLIIPVLFIFIVAIMDADFSNLQPALVNDARALVYGSLRLGFILTGLECLLLVSPYVPREKSLGKAVAGALAVAGLIIAAVTAITIASLGRGVENEPWPVLRMMDMITLPGSFIERQEALFFGFWIITAFALGNALLFFGGLLVRDTFKKTSLRTGVILTALGVFIVSILPLDREEIYEKIDLLYVTTGAFFLVVLPVVLLIAAKIKINGAKKAVKASFIGILILAVAALAGCRDSVEVENRAFVVAIGVEKSGENYAVTLSVPNFDENKDDDPHTKTAEGGTLTEAIKKLDAKNDKQLYYGQTKLLVLGTELLKDGEKLNTAVDALSNILQATRRIHVLAAEAPADILAARPPGEIMPGLYVPDIYRDKNKIGGTAFALDFESFSNATGAVIPKIERDGDELCLSGAAVLCGGKKIARLTPEELQGFLWFLPDGNQGAVVTAESPGAGQGKISMYIERHKANIRFSPGTPLHAIIEIDVKGKPGFPEENAEGFKHIFENKILLEATETATMFQKKIKTDGYGFLDLLRKKNYALYKQSAHDWQEIFQELEITAKVTVSFQS